MSYVIGQAIQTLVGMVFFWGKYHENIVGHR